MTPEISIVSPIYKEEGLISIFLDNIEKVMSEIDESYEVILIDDGSPDNSWKIMQQEAAHRPYLNCLRFSRNFGKEAALAAGLNASRGKAVVTMDCDLQHPPSLIAKMVELWKNNDLDIVEAHKENRQLESALDGFLVKIFYKIYSWSSTYDLNGASDFKLLDRKVITAWQQLPEHQLFYRGMTAWLGFKRERILFTPPDREIGQTKWSFLRKLNLALDSITAYTAKPLSIIFILTLVFLLMSIFIGGEALVMKINGQALTGFTTVILLILITGTCILFSLCVLAIYIRQIFYEIKGRPRYIISEVLDSTNYKSNS